jgi:hypothetical protein
MLSPVEFAIRQDGKFNFQYSFLSIRQLLAKFQYLTWVIYHDTK